MTSDQLSWVFVVDAVALVVAAVVVVAIVVVDVVARRSRVATIICRCGWTRIRAEAADEQDGDGVVAVDSAWCVTRSRSSRNAVDRRVE